jgi:hypothetical protein
MRQKPNQVPNFTEIHLLVMPLFGNSFPLFTATTIVVNSEEI